MDPALERELRNAGATESLIQLLKKLGNSPASAQPAGPSSSDDSSTLLRAAEDALGRKDYAEASKQLKAFVAKHPDRPDAWFNLGYAYTGLHETDEAAKAYQKIIELAPDLFAAPSEPGNSAAGTEAAAGGVGAFAEGHDAET